jgi:hypothetical protein
MNKAVCSCLAAILLVALVCPEFARADDLLAPPSPEFGRACATAGQGFVAVAGTETCMRVGGSVRVEAGVVSGGSKAGGRFKSRTVGTATMETRTETDLGLIRTFMQVQVPTADPQR